MTRISENGPDWKYRTHSTKTIYHHRHCEKGRLLQDLLVWTSLVWISCKWIRIQLRLKTKVTRRILMKLVI